MFSSFHQTKIKDKADFKENYLRKNGDCLEFVEAKNTFLNYRGVNYGISYIKLFCKLGNECV